MFFKNIVKKWEVKTLGENICNTHICIYKTVNTYYYMIPFIWCDRIDKTNLRW